MKFFITAAALSALLSCPTTAFVAPSASSFAAPATVRSAATLDDVHVAEDAVKDSNELKRQRLKQALLGRIGGSSRSAEDSVLADPLTKDSLSIMSSTGPILGGSTSRTGGRLTLRSSADSERVFEGRTNTYINLLEPASASTPSDTDEEEKTSVSSSPILASLLTLAPPPLRSIIANVTKSEVEYIPMRDLFTSPSVSFAYERGWRQGFAAAGFPGADKEFEMATEYFAPVIEKKRESNEDSVLVDMSCATGEFIVLFLSICTCNRNESMESLTQFILFFCLGIQQDSSQDDSPRAKNIQE